MTVQAPKKRGRKYDQVLNGALNVFMEHGFEGASVDEIAKVAGVSKATLYSYFPDKARLFSAVAEAKFLNKAESFLSEFDFSLPPSVLLLAGAKIVAHIATNDFDRDVYRIAVAEAQRFPELSADFYQNGPMLVRKVLVSYFEVAAARGELEIEDFAMAADQFAELCKASVSIQKLLGVRDEFSTEETDYVGTEATKTFLARYGTDKS